MKYPLLENNINIKNVELYFQLSQCFKICTLSKKSLCFIERCFSIIVDFQNFIELGLSSVKKILSSSKLYVDSELQVFYAVRRWLSQKPSERSRYAKNLLLKIRLPLLSVPVLNHVLDQFLYFVKDDKSCIDIIKDNIKNMNEYRLRTTSRYCSQNNFGFVIAGGKTNITGHISSDVSVINVNSLSKINTVPNLNSVRTFSNIVCIKGEIYVFGSIGYNYKPVNEI